jgi:putative copper resistance protein D
VPRVGVLDPKTEAAANGSDGMRARRPGWRRARAYHAGVLQLSVLLHVLAALVWVGGMFFVALVAVPVARRRPPEERVALLDALGRRFRVVGWASIGVLVVTGVTNVALRGVTWETVVSGQLAASTFGQLLVAKLLAVLAMLGLSAWHDFGVGPASTRAGTDPAGAAALRRRASRIGRTNAALALVVTALAVFLVRGPPW